MKNIKDEDQPATQGDLEIWGGNLLFEIEESRQENNERMDKQDKTLARHEGVLESILMVLQSINGKLAPLKETPEKVENHEKRITDLEVQVRMGRR